MIERKEMPSWKKTPFEIMSSKISTIIFFKENDFIKTEAVVAKPE